MTDKTLKHFFEVYKPKAPDEQKFVDKHVTIKHKDRNGNDDDVFKGNTKYIKRKEERHGYDVGEDEKVYEETEDLEELSSDTLRRYRMKAKSIGDNEKGDINYRAKGRELAGRKTYGGRMAGIEKAKVMAKEEVEDLEEGMMKLSKVHVVHHHDHPAAKEFAKNYTAGMKGEHREGGPNEADDKAANAFHQRYSGIRTREGFAGSGTHVYHDHKTGAKWKVDRHPNGKTFYGTDHIISHHTGDMHESFGLEEGEVLDTVAEDRVIRSLVAYYEELGEEVLIDDIVAIAEEMINELSVKTLDNYRTKARKEIIDADANDDNRLYNKRAKGYRAASKSVGKKFAKEEVEELDELSPATLGSYIKKAKTQMSRSDTVAGRLAGERMKGGKPSAQERKHNDRANKRYFGIDKAVDKLTKEEVESIDELSTGTLQSYRKKARAQGNNIVDKMKMGGGDWSKDQKDTKTLRKRAAGAQASGKQLVKRGESLKTEEVEDLEELSKKSLSNYIRKASPKVASHAASQQTTNDIGNMEYHGKKVINRLKGINTAAKKLTKEEVINRAVDKYSPSEEEKLSLDEQLVARIEDMQESHIHLILNLFEQLDESNQRNLLDMIDEGRINEVLDFAISAVRGE